MNVYFCQKKMYEQVCLVRPPNQFLEIDKTENKFSKN